MPTTNRLQQFFFTFLLLAAIILVFLMLKDFFAPLVVAFSLAVLFRPLYRRILRSVKGNGTLASFLTIAVVVVAVVVPLVIIGQILFNEAVGLLQWIASQGGGELVYSQFVDHFDKLVHEFAPHVSFDVTNYLQQVLQWSVSHLDALFTEIFHITFGLVIMVISLFYMFKDGDAFRDHYMRLSPLPDSYDKKIFDVMAKSVESVLKGSLIIALIQGFMGGIGSAIAGYQSPVIWGLMTAVVSFLPGIGTAVVLVPAILFKLLTGHVVRAIILLVWYILAVAFIDNFLGPHLIQRGGVKVHPFAILLGVLGGLTVFGPVGFIAGPLVMAIFFALLEIYPFLIDRS